MLDLYAGIYEHLLAVPVCKVNLPQIPMYLNYPYKVYKVALLYATCGFPMPFHIRKQRGTHAQVVTLLDHLGN